MKLRNGSVADILLMADLINKYMKENNVTLLNVNEMEIQKKFDDIMDKIEQSIIFNKEKKEVIEDEFEKAIGWAARK